MGLKKKILDAMDIFLGILREKTLQTLEEVEANTEDGCWAGAGAVAELNNKLGGCFIEQEGEDFYIVGADSVRKKLGETVSISTMTASIPYASSGTINIGAGYKSAYIIQLDATYGNCVGTDQFKKFSLNHSYDESTGQLSWHWVGMPAYKDATVKIVRIKVS